MTLASLRGHLASSFLGLSLLVTGCGPIEATAPPATPNAMAKKKVPGRFEVAVSGVSDAFFCSQQAGLKDFCVAQLQTSLRDGLNGLLGLHIQGKSDDAYQAEFKVLGVSHVVTASVRQNMPNVEVSMKWQFVLKGPDGEALVQLSETTKSPEPFFHKDAANQSVGALLNTVLERINTELNDRLEAAPAEAPPADAAPAAPEPAASAPEKDSDAKAPEPASAPEGSSSSAH
jgi:hypothetical protein